MDERRLVQALGEDSAETLLAERGMRILARNWRCRQGEIDLVARDGSSLVFVEVKCRTKDSPYDPALAVDRRKQLRLRRLARAYIASEGQSFDDCRFDVVSVVAGPPVRCRHIPDAF